MWLACTIAVLVKTGDNLTEVVLGLLCYDMALICAAGVDDCVLVALVTKTSLRQVLRRSLNLWVGGGAGGGGVAAISAVVVRTMRLSSFMLHCLEPVSHLQRTPKLQILNCDCCRFPALGQTL